MDHTNTQPTSLPIPLKTALYVLAFLVSTLTISTLPGQPVNFPKPEIISAEQGLPQGFIPGIVQDSRGLIWIATRNGLCRYDGQHIKIFRAGNGSPGDGSPGDGSPGDGSPRDGSPGDASPGDGSPRDGSPGDASPDHQTSLSSLGLESIKLADDKKIWVLSDQGDIDLFDPISETVVNYSKKPFFKKAFGNRFIKAFYTDSQNRLWLVFDKPGFACIDVETSRIRWYHDRENETDSLNTIKVRDLIQRKNGSVWLASKNGIFSIDRKTGNLIRYSSSDADFEDIEKSTYTLKERHNGDLLLIAKNGAATLRIETGKVDFFPLAPDEKAEYDHSIVSDSQGNDYFFRMNSILRFSDQEGVQAYPKLEGFSEYKAIYVDQSDVLWAGTNGQGVRKFNLRAAFFGVNQYQHSFVRDLLSVCLNAPENQIAKIPFNLFVYNFRHTFDKDQNLWFSSGTTPLYKFDLKSQEIEIVPFPLTIKYSERSEKAISLATDPGGRIWAVYDSLVFFYEHGDWQRFKYPVRPAIESGIMQLVVDEQALWIATSGKGLYRVDRTIGKIQQFRYDKNKANTLSNDNIYCLFADPDDPELLWIGTFGGGLCRFDKRTGLVRRITSEDGLPNDVVYTAIPDRLGNIWAATNQGLAQVNKKTLKVRVYTREDGLLADEFNRFHSLRLPDGRIFLGGIEGITSFDPARSNVDEFRPKTLITAISINNEKLETDKFMNPVTALQSLELDYWKNFVTVEFAAMQFNRSDKMKYRYRLEGLENDWIETENPVTKYTDLRPGTYLLHLNASNTEGVWSDDIRTLEILISPPWWQSWWAYLLYALIASALIYGLLKMYINRLKLRQSFILNQKELELIDKESQQLRQLDEMKTRFFSNITHEFRTPLTLILAPAEQMLEEKRPAEDMTRLGLIDRNAHQLLGLVNQLLDLSKLESGTMKVTEAQSNLQDFVAQLVGAFQVTAEAKKIRLTFTATETANAYWFDHEKLERILNNLLSNALKFTPENGQVSVQLTGYSDGVMISVSDTGTGIPPEKLEHVFERFYQVDSETGYREGTGIGLAIVKELVEIQGGNVRVESGEENSGANFVIELPYRTAPLASGNSVSQPTLPHEYLSEQATENRHSEIKILLVEDHLELGDFVAKSLSKNYQCYRAGNGKEALTLMQDMMPDLVISDVMMPVMDGNTLCRKIKSDLLTSHIPVILLTAKNAVASKMEGLAGGADDYVTKPFHMPELEIRVGNMLERQRRFREMLQKQFTTQEKVEQSSASEVTDPFLTRLYNILDAQLDNTQFGVNELTLEIGMSNSSLNRKLKALTDLSPVELIRNYRLKKAAEYLANGTGVSEAAYLVGFDNLSYFAKCFRDLFQMSPRDFAAKV
ncbi:hybrid sensor histidine kinase/response regulator transcription factor [Dyadobacter aurulentus]|uniref:hybrid sensor histidine kinase/response regulator transcription factor n=1 Tax=Dyadobacter sp. UC 10 TaxID=2605428 RepID=UPI0011F375CC|nr:ATP-binding protein [Dyadobacter sp. UC 10]KAA0993525.1 response regulator [Dyadobacter sp. UC 10]